MINRKQFWQPVFIVFLMLSFVQPSIAQSLGSNTLPANSVYHLQVAVEDQFGEITGLDRYKGHPVLVTMFYTSCPHVCPMLISTIKIMESVLSDEERADLRVITISIDPERDTPEKLHETMERHSVRANRWSMVRSNPNDLRAIAGVFGIKYKQLPDGEFNHTTRITLLNREGTQVASTELIGGYDEAFLEAIKTSLLNSE
jgi:protein SCO1/2